MPLAVLFWTLLIAPTVPAAQATKSQKRPNLILITIDTLRADYVSALNPESPVETTAIDSLANEGIIFTDASTTNPLTTPAHASLMTGLWPLTHGVRDFTGYRLDGRHQTLAETLETAGYQTAAFVSAAVLDRRTGMSQGFQHYSDGFESFLGNDARVAERPGKEILEEAAAWVSGFSGPLFLWVHLFEPHDPYLPPQPFRSRYPSDAYAGEVAYTDALLADWFARLKTLGLFDSSVIVLLSDHGEGLGDHGESKHGFFLYQSTMRIPWVMRLPGGKSAGQKIGQPVSIVDVYPTVLHALELERSAWPRSLQGRSRYQLALGGGGRPAVVYLESLTPRNQFGWSDLRAVREGKYKFIDAPRPELYDLESDPGEEDNLVDVNRALTLQLKETLGKLEKTFEESEAPTIEADPELQQRLRSLGYVGVQSATQASEGRLADPKDKIVAYEHFQAGVEAARNRRWTSALSELRQASTLEPDSPAIVASLTLALRDSGRLPEAVSGFQRLLELTPDDVSMRLEFAQLLIQQRRSSQARQQMEAVLEREPRNFIALFNLGTLEGQEGNFRQAAEYFQRAVEVREDPQVLSSLALAKSYLGQPLEALQHLQRALELEPRARQLHRQIAEVYRSLGKVEEARRHQKLADQ